MARIGIERCMSDAFDGKRRRLIGGAAATIAAAALGVGCVRAQSSAPQPLPGEGRMPPLDGATEWLNSAPLSGADLRGRIVLVQFWTYTCINWRRTLPHVRAWAEKYTDHGLVVIGVHTPEFGFEHDLDNVRWALKDMRVDYPVAVDNDHAIWDRFANQYWPALYFVDADGRIRRHYFGEGAFEESERVIQQLLNEAGATGVDADLVTADARGAEVAAEWNDLESPEQYLGFARTERFASSGGALRGSSRVYDAPAQLKVNQWALAGNWTFDNEAVVLDEVNGRIAYQFHARDLHLVMGPVARRTSIPFRVRIDGQAPTAAHGFDVDDQGNGTLAEQRLYQLIRQPLPVAERRFEIEFLDSGVGAYAFTFG
jgi:thiol-disulfide isomerase/thioredoxin